MISIPTTTDLYNQLKTSFETALNVTIPETGKSSLRTFCRVHAAKMKAQYLAIANVQKNVFPDIADPESMGGTLERYGVVKLGRARFAAIAPQYTVQVTGSVGAVIPAFTTFKSDDTSLSPGQPYILDNDFTLDGINIITLRAIVAGDVSALAPADKLTVTAPIALVDSKVTVIAETVAPQEAETIEEFRAKIVQAFRLEAQGGAPADYRLWASDVQSVAQSYPYVVSGNSNQINLFIEAVLADSTDGKGTPSVAILDDVQEAIEDPTADRPARKPLGVFQVNYLPVVVKNIEIAIDSFVGITVDQQTLIFDAMKEALAVTRPLIGGIDVFPSANDEFGTNKIISIILSTIPGASFGAITLEVDSVPVTDYTFDNGEIPYLDTITYV